MDSLAGPVALKDVHTAVVDFLKAYGIGTWWRTPPSLTNKLIIMEVQDKNKAIKASQILYVLQTIRENKSLRNPGK